MKHSVPHDLDPATARRVADRAFESYAARFEAYHPEIHWVTDRRAQVSFRAKGIRLAGELSLDDHAIAMDLGVPLLLRPFKKKALGVIDEEVRRWIDKAHEGAL